MTWLAFSPLRSGLFAAGVVVTCLTLPDSPAVAEPVVARQAEQEVSDDFQVTVEVMELDAESGEQSQLDLHLILFRDGKAYDFALTAPRDVTVVDPAQDKITLLSRVRHVKATLPTQDLTSTAARVRLFAKNEGIEERLGLTAKVQVEGDRYQMKYSGFDYDVTTQTSQTATQAAKFAEFTDWAARINLIRKLGTPPFARMQLGRRIAVDGRLPETITLKLTSGEHRRTLMSRYRFESGLSDAASKRIDEVGGMMTLYQEVDLEAFPK